MHRCVMIGLLQIRINILDDLNGLEFSCDTLKLVNFVLDSWYIGFLLIGPQLAAKDELIQISYIDIM